MIPILHIVHSFLLNYIPVKMKNKVLNLGYFNSYLNHIFQNKEILFYFSGDKR